MFRVVTAGAFLFLSSLTGVLADQGSEKSQSGRSYLGHGRLVVNDDFADFQDRWRTGSVSASRVWGPTWQGRLPGRPGEVLEFRLKGEIIAPSDLAGSTAGDRPYVGALSFGGHTHFQRGGWDLALGAGLVVTGPQTGLADFQEALHSVGNFAGASAAVRAGQIPNGVHGQLNFAVDRDFEFTRGRVRPFAETQIGVETLARIGADVTFGPAGKGELLIRDEVTGHRYRVVEQAENGFSLVVGGDVAHVFDTIYLPQGSAGAKDTRVRLRSGVHWQTDSWRGFYGLTWLSEEFQGQPNGQVLGALRLDFQF